MILTVDIGNTTTVAGIFDGEDLRAHWRLYTVREKTSDEYGFTLKGLLINSSIEPDSIKGAIISCVVPSLRDVFVSALREFLGVRPVVVEPGIKTGISISVDDPREVGADRIVNAVAGYHLYGGNIIIVDFGTAITFDYITDKGEYKGGVIAPGIGVSADALFKRASRLPRVDVSKPRTVVGKNTVECIRAGIFYGFVGLVEGIIERMKRELGTSPRVIATGGYAASIAEQIEAIEKVDEFLVLRGLRILYEVNGR